MWVAVNNNYDESKSTSIDWDMYKEHLTILCVLDDRQNTSRGRILTSKYALQWKLLFLTGKLRMESCKPSNIAQPLPM